MMIVTLYFAWHFAAVLVFMTLTGTLIYWKVKKLNKEAVYDSMFPYSQTNHKIDVEQLRNIIVESEEEI